jgi:hypothetical protein
MTIRVDEPELELCIVTIKIIILNLDRTLIALSIDVTDLLIWHYFSFYEFVHSSKLFLQSIKIYLEKNNCYFVLFFKLPKRFVANFNCNHRNTIGVF